MHSKVAESFCGERMGKHSFEMLLICHEMWLSTKWQLIKIIKNHHKIIKHQVSIRFHHQKCWSEKCQTPRSPKDSPSVNPCVLELTHLLMGAGSQLGSVRASALKSAFMASRGRGRGRDGDLTNEGGLKWKTMENGGLKLFNQQKKARFKQQQFRFN